MELTQEEKDALFDEFLEKTKAQLIEEFKGEDKKISTLLKEKLDAFQVQLDGKKPNTKDFDKMNYEEKAAYRKLHNMATPMLSGMEHNDAALPPITFEDEIGRAHV